VQATPVREPATDPTPVNRSARLVTVTVLRTPRTQAQCRTLVDLLRKSPAAVGEFRRVTAKESRERGPRPGTVFQLRVDRDSAAKIDLLVAATAVSASAAGEVR
jgi:hypothetical protein